jgi:hypothetical protein
MKTSNYLMSHKNNLCIGLKANLYFEPFLMRTSYFVHYLTLSFLRSKYPTPSHVATRTSSGRNLFESFGKKLATWQKIEKSHFVQSRLFYNLHFSKIDEIWFTSSPDLAMTASDELATLYQMSPDPRQSTSA